MSNVRFGIAKDLLREAGLGADSEIAKTTEYKPFSFGEWLAVPLGLLEVVSWFIHEAECSTGCPRGLVASVDLTLHLPPFLGQGRIETIKIESGLAPRCEKL